MIEISRTQDEEVGDGTTSVIILGMCHCINLITNTCGHDTAGEVLSMAETFIEQQIHPTVIISAYRQALDDIVEAARKIRYYMYLHV